MPIVTGYNIEISKGETLYLDVTVVTSAGVAANLAGATAVCVYKKHGGTAVTKTCTIASNVITTLIPASETALLSGGYRYTVTMTKSGEVDELLAGVLEVS